MYSLSHFVKFIFLVGVAKSVIQVPAFGRPADLASFYDAKKDQFYPVSALTGSFPAKSVIPTLRSNVECSSSIVTSLDSKLSSIGLSLGSKIDVLTGVMGMSGSIGYAQEDTYDTHSVYGAVHYKRYTMYETFHARLEEVQSLLSLNPAKILPATHVVLGVMWGVDIVISFRFKKSEISSTSVSTAEFESSLKQMAYSVQVGSKLDSSKSKTAKYSNSDIKIFGDLLIPNIPTTMEEVEELLKNIPKILNSTKGQPQYFDLIDVHKLQNIIDFDTQYIELNDTKLNLNLDKSHEIVSLESSLLYVYEQKEKTMSEIMSLKSKIHKLEFIFANKVIQKLDKLYSKYESTFLVFNARFKNMILKCRSNMNIHVKTEFLKVKTNYLKHKFGPVKALLKVRRLMVNATSKLADYEVFKVNGVFMARKDFTSNQLRLEHSNETVRFLFYTEEWKQQDPQMWKDITNWFIGQTGVKFIVDCDLELHKTHSCPFLDDRIHNGHKLVVVTYDKKTKLDYESNIYKWYEDAYRNEWRTCMRTLACEYVAKIPLFECIKLEAIRYYLGDYSKDNNYDLCKGACL